MFLLITGASGVGKTTVRRLLAPALMPLVECVELTDLVPRPARITKVWRQQTAEVAVRRAIELQASDRHLLLAGDPVPAAEVVAAPSAPELDAIAVCLLDATPKRRPSDSPRAEILQRCCGITRHSLPGCGGRRAIRCT
jgi:energy-coupling factor transporter ATP-binding protein EcfA2